MDDKTRIKTRTMEADNHQPEPNDKTRLAPRREQAVQAAADTTQVKPRVDVKQLLRDKTRIAAGSVPTDKTRVQPQTRQERPDPDSPASIIDIAEEYSDYGMLKGRF